MQNVVTVREGARLRSRVGLIKRAWAWADLHVNLSNIVGTRLKLYETRQDSLGQPGALNQMVVAGDEKRLDCGRDGISCCFVKDL